MLVRVILIAAACWFARLPLQKFALLHDGWEYLRLARAFAHGGIAQLDPATLRLYLGYPSLIALLGAGRAYVLPGLIISILCGATCAPLAARLGRDNRIAWWLVVLTPSWLVYSSTVMSDSLALLLAIATLMLIIRRSWAWAGLAAGIAFCVRPVGALLFIPLAMEAWADGGVFALARAFAVALPWPLIYMISSRILLGSAVRAIHQYTFQDLAMPLSSLFSAARNPAMSKALIVYELGVLALTWIGAFGLWRRLRSGERAMRPLFTWHIAAALFYLFLPSSWAFQALDRFYLAIWPTTLIGLAPWLPRRGSLNLVLMILSGILSFVLASRWLINLSAIFPFAERGF